MKKERRPSAKSLRVKVKDEKVTITFDAYGWKPIHSALLDSVAADAESQNIPVAEYMGHAVALKGMAAANSKEDFDRWVRLLGKLVDDEEAAQTLSDDFSMR